MKITDNRTRAATVFGKLSKGDVFFSPADGEYFMVTSTIVTEINDYNAVCLSSGNLDLFYNSDEVEKVEAELVISH